MKRWNPCHIEKALNITSLYTAFIRQYDENLNFAGEAHNFWEISCVLDGTVCVASDSDVFTVTAGHAIIFRPMTFHRLWVGEGDPPKLATISFDADLNIDITDCVFDHIYGEESIYVMNALKDRKNINAEFSAYYIIG